MASYQARRSTDEARSSKDARADQNNAQNVKNAAEVAKKSKNPYAMAAGYAVNVGDKLTGGKFSEKLGKGITDANKKAGLAGKIAQNKLNKLNESGAGDKIGQAASLSNGGKSGGATGGKVPDINKKDAMSNGMGRQDLDNKIAENQANANNSAINNSSVLDKKKKSGKTAGEGESEPEKEEPGNNKVDIKATIKKVKIALIVGGIAIAILTVVLIISMLVEGVLGKFNDGLGANDESGGNTGDMDYEENDEDAEKFYQLLEEVRKEQLAKGRYLDVTNVVAVYYVMSVYDESFSYDDMTKRYINKIVDAMFDGNTYNESYFKGNLKTDFFAKRFPDASEQECADMAQEVLDYINDYKEFVGEDTYTCSTLGSCSYTIKGFNINNVRYAKVINPSDIKVRLMQCRDLGYGKPIDGEELVDFEKYILGVVYGEIRTQNPTAQSQVQAIAARSYALTRPTAMGNAAGLKLAEENGQWILQIRNCTDDQVYCDPDKGCTTSSTNMDRGGYTVFSGNRGPIKVAGPLAANDALRSQVAAVVGKYAVDSEGYVVNTGYQSTAQNAWKDMANRGMNYQQILIQHYAGRVNGIANANCNNRGSEGCGISSGDFATWKQYGEPWSNIYLGHSSQTIAHAGCLATSIAILIAKSGVPTNVNGEFNPGTFVQAMTANGGFSGANLVWGAVSKVAPRFQYSGQIGVAGLSMSEKFNKISELLSKGAYITAEVKGNTGQHWVAIDTIQGNTVIMMDPSSTGTNLWGTYPWYNTSRLAYFYVR